METVVNNAPVVVIVGPTASGKTALAIRLARECGGEIISADSRAIYKGLDVGTAKPTEQEQQAVPHWGIDLVAVNERFTAVDFKQYVLKKIADIRLRGKVPFLVGGTGLYIDAVIYDYEFPSDNDLNRRHELEGMPLDELWNYCAEHNISLPENHKNKRHVINTILRDGHASKMKSHPIENSIIVGITTKKDILRQRIEQRAQSIFTSGAYEEAIQIANKYGWENEAMTGNIYPLIRMCLNRELTIEQAQEKFITLDWRLAKRQLTWFKRNEHIHWLLLDDAYTYLARYLAGVNKS